jgi:uroporphyrinogen decarboxylase
LIDLGVDRIKPLEVKAGIDPAGLKKLSGSQLAFHGGLNAVLSDHPEELWAEMRGVIPVMKAGGGVMISSDHSVPQTVSLEQPRIFVVLAKELGSCR